MTAFVRTPERIAADVAALEWFGSFVAAADPIIIGEHGYEIEGRNVDTGWAHWHRDGICIAARIASFNGEVWAQLDATDDGKQTIVPADLLERLVALGARDGYDARVLVTALPAEA